MANPILQTLSVAVEAVLVVANVKVVEAVVSESKEVDKNKEPPVVDEAVVHVKASASLVWPLVVTVKGAEADVEVELHIA